MKRAELVIGQEIGFKRGSYSSWEAVVVMDTRPWSDGNRGGWRRVPRPAVKGNGVAVARKRTRRVWVDDAGEGRLETYWAPMIVQLNQLKTDLLAEIAKEDEEHAQRQLQQQAERRAREARETRLNAINERLQRAKIQHHVSIYSRDIEPAMLEELLDRAGL